MIIAESLMALHTHTHTSNSIEKDNKLYLNKISFINNTKKYIKINKDRLFLAKVRKLLQNSLSILCVLEVIYTKDKYA